jgi:multidrug resistance efflux pump
MRFQTRKEVSTPEKIADAGGDLRRAFRRRRFRRWLFVIALLFVVVLVAFADRCWINADGIIVGQLTPVSPISEVQITKLVAKCLDYVSEGQTIAQLENRVTEQAGVQQLQQLQIELAQAREEAQIADKEAESAVKYRDAQAAVESQLQTVYAAETELLKKNYVSELAWQKSKADVIKAGADTQAAEYAVETKQEDAKRAQLEAGLIDDRITSLKASPELMGSYALTAPKAGYLTQCNAYQGQVINPDTVIYQMFNPSDAFAIAFLDPGDAPRLKPGEEIPVKVSGMKAPITATVSSFYPEYSGLPAALTRYFWEEQKWSQFEPVRFDFYGLSDAERKALRASAEVSISIWRLPTTGVFGWLVGLLRPQGS